MGTETTFSRDTHALYPNGPEGFHPSPDEIELVRTALIGFVLDEQTRDKLEARIHFYNAFATLLPRHQFFLVLRFAYKFQGDEIMRAFGFKLGTYAGLRTKAIETLSNALGYPLAIVQFRLDSKGQIHTPRHPITRRRKPDHTIQVQPYHRVLLSHPTKQEAVEREQRILRLKEGLVAAVAYASQRPLPYQLPHRVQAEALESLLTRTLDCLSYLAHTDAEIPYDSRVLKLVESLPLSEPPHDFAPTSGSLLTKDEALARLLVAIQSHWSALLSLPLHTSSHEDLRRATLSLCIGMSEAYQTLTRSSIEPFDHAVFEALRRLSEIEEGARVERTTGAYGHES